MVKITGQVIQLIRQALKEDIGSGDITTSLIVDSGCRAKAVIVAKSSGILCGLAVCQEAFRQFDKGFRFKFWHEEGKKIRRGEKIAEIEGKAAAILAAERTALNFLQHLSGIATLTSSFVNKVKSTGVQICDTRKTTPGWRYLEKYAVRTGGGKNHRLGLYDQILIKENHIKIAGSISKAIYRAKIKNKRKLLLEVETKNLREIREALLAGTDWIMLDNFSPPQIKPAIRLIRQFSRRTKKKITIEVSGNVNLRNVRGLAQTGPDLISVGQLTHSAPALDFSLKILKCW